MDTEKRGDDDQLAALGHRAELKRNFSTLYVSASEFSGESSRGRFLGLN